MAKRKIIKPHVITLSAALCSKYGLMYCVDYDRTDQQNWPQHEEDCSSGGYTICRCRTITRAWVTIVRIAHITGELCVGYKKDILMPYFVDKILRMFGIWKLDAWEPIVRSGYYGEEIGGVNLKATIVSAVDQALIGLTKLTKLSEQVEFVLVSEYGYLLDVLNERKWKAEKVKIKDMSFPSETYQQPLNPDVIESYKEYPYIHAICIADGPGKYSVIDGRHRIAAARQDDKRLLNVLVGYSN